jgi:hypothetical protein
MTYKKFELMLKIEKLKIEKEKLRIEKEKLKLLKNDDNDNAELQHDRIRQYIEATSLRKKEVAELFEDDRKD